MNKTPLQFQEEEEKIFLAFAYISTTLLYHKAVLVYVWVYVCIFAHQKCEYLTWFISTETNHNWNWYKIPLES